MSEKKKKRYRYELTDSPLWRNIVPLLRLTNPEALLKWLKGEKRIEPNGDYHKVEKQVQSQKQALSSLSTRVKTLEDLLKEGEVNTDKWQVSSYTQNFWETGSKNPSGVILPCTLYQVKAILKPKTADFTILKNGILDEIRRKVKPVAKINYPKTHKDLLVEICVMDLHAGKVAYDKDMNNIWPLKKVEKIYQAVIDDVLNRVDVSRIDRFVLPTGNDILHIDGTHNSTTRGTPMQASNEWENLMLFTYRMLKRAIEKLSGIAPVYVPFVAGNHSQDSCFSLGGFISATFESNPNVFVDNEPRKRKYHSYGNCLIGYTHGNNVKAKDLHAIMSTDKPLLFGKAKYRAFRTGHLHYNKTSRVLFKDLRDEYHGVITEVCPSLCPTDSWHYQKGFIGNLRRSKSFIWSKNEGIIQELYFNI